MMPRVGDPDSSSVYRIAAELGYLSCIIVGSCLGGNMVIDSWDCITTYNHWCEPLRTLGDPFLAWNCIYLVLDKINLPYARPWSRWRI
jgi:hypothetical protein